jgi:hypothetical protein
MKSVKILLSWARALIFALPYHEPLALVAIEVELSHGGSLGRCPIRRLHDPKEWVAFPENPNAPSAGLVLEGAVVFRGLH